MGATGRYTDGIGAGMPEVIESQLLHQGAKFDLVQMKVRFNGRVVTREIVHHPGAVVVLPVLDDGRYVLIRNQRIAVGGPLWEICAGTLEPCEAPEACAARELIEETGYRAERIERLGEFYSSPGMSDERLIAFVARGLSHIGQRLEDDEEIDVDSRSSAEVHDMIDRGELKDGKTMLAILMYERLRATRRCNGES